MYIPVGGVPKMEKIKGSQMELHYGEKMLSNWEIDLECNGKLELADQTKPLK